MAKKHSVRCSQIIYPHGVGSMVIGTDRSSYIVCGLDAWFHQTTVFPNQIDNDLTEFIIRENRLEQILEVSHFRLPPYYKERRRGNREPNTDLKIPVLRFPQWHICKFCDRMEFIPLTQEKTPICPYCREDNKNMTSFLTQIPLIALCENGHLQDFPWREWCHKKHKPECDRQLFYLRSGGGTLAGQKIKCECGIVRSLAGIDRANYAETYLTRNLSKDEGYYLCRGNRPWLAETTNTKCERHLRGNFRGAGNVWFGQIVSAIYLPESDKVKIKKLDEFLSSDEVNMQIQSLEKLEKGEIINVLKAFHSKFLKNYSNDEISNALDINQATNDEIQLSSDLVGRTTLNTDKSSIAKDETDFRFSEYQILRTEQDDEQLVSRNIKITPQFPILANNFSNLVLVHRLRETRVFSGFTRIFSDVPMQFEDKVKMLRRDHIEDTQNSSDISSPNNSDWLPATTVFGEGIFLEFDEQKLERWEELNALKFENYLKPIRPAFEKHSRNKIGNIKKDKREKITPRFVLAHTLAHLLIRELVFECGYSAAALRERLYISNSNKTKMAGILIYTADGDSEGTLGGLVRMGNPQNLERLLKKAFAKSKWCSSDPVCTELGKSHGQGPDSCNLAACHSCALLPETSCEEFNKFLDRILIQDYMKF